MTKMRKSPYEVSDMGICGPGIGPKFLGDEEILPGLNVAYAEGVKAERERCYAIASRDVEVVDNVSGSSFMCKPNCSCAKDIIAGGINENNK